MNERALSMLEQMLKQYDLEVFDARKGRGSILCDTSLGTLVLKEYEGNERRLELEERLLRNIRESTEVLVDDLIPTKEGAWCVRDPEGKCYVLKTLPEGRESDLRDRKECVETVQVLARLHGAKELSLDEEESGLAYSPMKEYEKHNRELIKIRSYLRKKGRKQRFEAELSEALDFFLPKGQKVAQDWEYYEGIFSDRQKDLAGSFCHGDFQYHNVLRGEAGFHVINFEKFIRDDKVRDLGLFLRKLLEKTDWDVEFGRSLIQAYQQIRPLSAASYIDLYYRLSYPEKFWKIANFYYNSKKAWIPEKNREKLRRIVGQEQEKNRFLEQVFEIGK